MVSETKHKAHGLYEVGDAKSESNLAMSNLELDKAGLTEITNQAGSVM